MLTATAASSGGIEMRRTLKTLHRRLKTLLGLTGAKGPKVDEEWYLSQYPDVRAAV